MTLAQYIVSVNHDLAMKLSMPDKHGLERAAHRLPLLTAGVRKAAESLRGVQQGKPHLVSLKKESAPPGAR